MAVAYHTSGLVLGRTNFGEADRIITFLTPDHGKVRAVAKGVRKIKSRMGGHLEPFGFVDLMLAPGRNLEVVTSARLLQYWPELTANYNRLSLAHLFVQLLTGLSSEGQAQPELYGLAKEVYAELAITQQLRLLELYLKLRLLEAVGYRPELVGCSVCGRTTEDSYSLSPERGGLVDIGCSVGGIALDKASIKLWRLLLAQSFASVARVQGAEAAAAASVAACDEFYGYHFGKQFRLGLAMEVTP